MGNPRSDSMISTEQYTDLIGSLPPEETNFANETQEEAASAVDALYDAQERLATFVLRNPMLFTRFHALCEETKALEAAVKEKMQAIEPEGPFQYRDIQRKSAPMSVVYDGSKLPPEILRRPGIITKIDGKVLDKLAVNDLADYATILRDARSEVFGTASVVNPLKTPDTKITRKILATT